MAQTHHYLFDNTNSYNDSTGSTNFTNTGSASIVSGKINQCLNMVGYNASGAAYTATNLLPTSGAFTIAFWFNSGSQDWFNTILQIVPSVFGFGLRVDYYGKSLNLHLTDGISDFYPSGVLLGNTWYHLIISWDGASWNIYYNNVLQTTIYGTTFTPNANTYDASSSFTIQYGSSFYNTKIDDLRIYNNAIDATERAFIYNGGTGTQADSGGGGGGGTSYLTVATQVPKAYFGRPIYPVVNIISSGNVVDGSATNTVYAAVVSGTATLAGNTNVSAVSGVASFSGMTITGLGSIGLAYTASGLSGTFGNYFNIDIPVPVRPIRSETAGVVPTSGQLQIGELAINIADQKGYVKKTDGTIATVWQSITSGQVTSGYIGNAAVVSGSIGSGQIGTFHITTGGLLSGAIASGQVGEYHIFDASVVSGKIASGQVGEYHLSDNSVTSGAIASGSIDSPHIALEAIKSYHLSSGSILSGSNAIGEGAITSGQISSGLLSFAISSGQILSGMIGDAAVVSGSIASGQIGQFHLSSGSVTSGAISSGVVGINHLSSGCVRSGVIGSGQIGTFHITTGGLLSGAIGSGQIGQFHLSSGSVTSGAISSGVIGINHLSSGSVRSGVIGSGQIGTFHITTGGLLSGAIGSGQIGQFHLSSGSVTSGAISSGVIGINHLASGSVTSGAIGSGQIGQFHLSSGSVRSGVIASGQIQTFHIGSTTVPNSGHVLQLNGNSLQFNAPVSSISSGQIISGMIGNNAVGSGSVFSGTILPIIFNNNSGSNNGNIGLGDFVFGNITSGSFRNIGLGAATLKSIASGSNDNTAVGAGALAVLGFLAIGSTNVAVGNNALAAITSGNSNTAVGYAAGYEISGGVAGGFSLGNFNTYLGHYTRAGNNNPQYEIVIGANAIGFGSGTTTIGHATNTKSGVIYGSIAFPQGLASGTITSGAIASGQIGQFHLSSGSITSGAISSGVIGINHLASGSVTSGAISSGVIGLNHLGLEVENTLAKVNNFRLSVVSGLPVTSGSLIGQTTVHLVPYNGDSISLYDGTNWGVYTTSGTSVSLSVASGTVASGKLYDIYCYNNAGVPALELSTVWTTQNARADAIRFVNGVPLKSGTLTRRFVGTLMTSQSGSGVDDCVPTRGLWNWDNRVTRYMGIVDNSAYTYNTSGLPVYRIWGSNSGNIMIWVQGYAGLGGGLTMFTGSAKTAGAAAALAIGATFSNADMSSFVNTYTLQTTTTYLSAAGNMSCIQGYNYVYPAYQVNQSGTYSAANVRLSATIEG